MNNSNQELAEKFRALRKEIPTLPSIELGWHEGVWAVAAGAGHYVVSAAEDGSVKIWDTDNVGQSLAIDIAHEGPIFKVFFLKNHPVEESTFVTVSVDNHVKIWSIEGKCLETFDAGQEIIDACGLTKHSIGLALKKEIVLWETKLSAFLRFKTDFEISSIAKVNCDTVRYNSRDKKFCQGLQGGTQYAYQLANFDFSREKLCCLRTVTAPIGQGSKLVNISPREFIIQSCEGFYLYVDTEAVDRNEGVTAHRIKNKVVAEMPLVAHCAGHYLVSISDCGILRIYDYMAACQEAEYFVNPEMQSINSFAVFCDAFGTPHVAFSSQHDSKIYVATPPLPCDFINVI